MSPTLPEPDPSKSHREMAVVYMDQYEEHMADAAKCLAAAFSENLMADIEENRVLPRVIDHV